MSTHWIYSGLEVLVISEVSLYPMSIYPNFIDLRCHRAMYWAHTILSLGLLCSQHIYLIYCQLVFMFLVPFLCILIMNVGLILKVNRSREMRVSMTSSATREHNLTVMLIAVIVVFLVCQFPAVVDQILVALVGEETLSTYFSYSVSSLTQLPSSLL